MGAFGRLDGHNLHYYKKIVFAFLNIINDTANSIWPVAYKKQSIVYGFVQWHLKDLD